MIDMSGNLQLYLMKEQKKVSLFKQKLQQKRVDSKRQINGFPVAPLVVQEIKASDNIIEVEKTQKHIKQKPEGFLKALDGSKVLGQTQAQKIQSQNWNIVQKMSQQERQKAIEQLMAQLPDSFLTAINKTTKIVEEKQNQSESQEEFSNNNQKEAQEPALQGLESWQHNLKLNVKTFALEWTASNEEHLNNLQKLALIAGHENNQSMVVGADLLKLWSKAISNLLTTKTRELIIIDRVPVHAGMVALELKKAILLSIDQARKTSYKSVFLEICACVSEAIINIENLLSFKSKQDIALKLGKMLTKVRDLDIKVEQAVNIKDSLDSIITRLHAQEENTHWITLIDSANIIVELALLENSFEQGYWFKAYKFAQKCCDFQQLLQLLAFIYEFIHKMIIKRNQFPYIDIKLYRQLWTSSVDALILKFSQSCWNIDPEYIFKSVFLARFVGGVSWEAMVNTLSLFQEKSPLAAGFILFNTFPDLKVEQLTKEQTSSLNLALGWISTFSSSKEISRLDPNYILSTLLQIFYVQNQYYSCLDQQILQSLLHKIFRHPLTDIEHNITTEQINTLTKNYNYNSFGNQVFTYLLLAIAWNTSVQKQGIILKQSVLPCWKQFFTVGSAFGISKEKPANKDSNRDLKDQVLEKIREEIGMLQQKNALLQLLSQ